MATTTARKPVTRKRLPDPVACHLCPQLAATDTDLVIHLVEEHGAVWTSTNSFGLDDLVIPTPRESFEDRPGDDAGWVRRLIRRTG
jgi:hypothetical protein